MVRDQIFFKKMLEMLWPLAAIVLIDVHTVPYYSPQICGKNTAYSPHKQIILRKYAAIKQFILRI